MVKVWAGKKWRPELKSNGTLEIWNKKMEKKYWYQSDWPPVRLVVLTEEEYEALSARPFYQEGHVFHPIKK